jgi:hypothetical protein
MSDFNTVHGKISEMSQDELRLIIDEEQGDQGHSEKDVGPPIPVPPRSYYANNYPIREPKRNLSPRDEKITWSLVVVIFSLNILLVFGCWVNVLCQNQNDWRIESIEISVDSDAEIDEELLNKLYYDLDEDSRANVTNETYYLELTIDYMNEIIRFDYNFKFESNKITNL